MRILIAEDELIIAYALRGQLQKRGVEIVGLAANGRKALELCRQAAPEVVLMDVRMPQTDGIQATRLIMENCPTCIIVVTAYCDEETRAKAEAAGAMGFLAKPVQVGAVLEAIPGAQARFAEFQEICAESPGLEDALKTRLLLEKAEEALVARGETTAGKAFQHLQALAAQSGATLRETAVRILEPVGS